jgi:hypothetical protein
VARFFPGTTFKKPRKMPLRRAAQPARSVRNTIVRAYREQGKFFYLLP